MALFVSALILGVTLGTIYALMAFGMVACYRISAVVNMGQAGVATFSASLYWWLETVRHSPRILSVVVAILVGVVFGAMLGQLSLRLSSWPKGMLMILTLVVTLLLLAWSDLILPGWNPLGPTVFGRGGFDVALVHVNADQIGSFATCLIVVLATTWVLRTTRFGLFVRIIYDDRQTAATMGIPLSRYVTSIWAVAGGMAGLAGILISTRTTLYTPLLLIVMVWALAGAVLGGLESFALALAGGVLLGVAQGLLGAVTAGVLGPGLENLSAVAITAAGVLYAGHKRRHLAYLQT